MSDALSDAPRLTELASYLDALLGAASFPGDQNGVWRHAPRRVRRLGLAVEPWPEVGAWVAREQLDALFLHRPWRLAPGALAPDVGVVAYHLAFDERLTVGWNPRLAAALGMRAIAAFGEKEGRPLGMLGDVAACAWDAFRERVEGEFGGGDEAVAPDAGVVRRVAVVGAMTDALVRDAARAGADAYVTGQLRQPARRAVGECGLGVIAVGHGRGERWGVRALAALVRERWPGVETREADNS